ncbi:MAG: hypothetical protein K2I13_07600 [Alistipes sp.]|nr:hypothetical protein [Alistipes sp.]
MNRLFRYVLLVCTLACGSCSGDKEDIAPIIKPAIGADIADLAGEWRLCAWSGGSDLSKEVYLRLNADRTFTLYQNLVSHGFQQFDGTFSFDSANAAIRGSYSDGTSWGGVYIVGSITQNSMQWQMVGTSDIATYTRTAIPDLTIEPASRAALPACKPFL